MAASGRPTLTPSWSATGLLPEPYLQGEGQPYRWGGVLSEHDSFDPAFFGIPVFEAHSMSAHQRLVLCESWRAIENAGVDPHAMRGSSVGVFVGVEPTCYMHQTLTGASDAVIAGRVSYILNFSGPALVINTACSSSLVVIHIAAESLRSGECNMAIAGGVYADLNQRTLAALVQSGMLSPNGECKTFDAAANDTGVDHDGASNGQTVPSGEAQERLLRSVYRPCRGSL
ncbi:polyketide synthase [Agrobacterium vitis]|uniref:beta-ketoacyl [acyl carrier protein] synthase domain-containing protein n=1 Tax=Agrobacterium vitis TaxID=373 RepID=UPI002A037338|nr:polyketide synthase [Agrobacterium vitis]MCF1455026.1 polyketide synthase [Agrobacterium vitis]